MSTETETNGKASEHIEAQDQHEETMSNQESQAIVLSDSVKLTTSPSLPNNRPITASDLQIVATLNAMGHRPIVANTFQIAHSDTLPEHRPVAVSNLMDADTSRLPGHRPIASNEIDDPKALMGYLD
jgi:hypothetical protein